MAVKKSRLIDTPKVGRKDREDPKAEPPAKDQVDRSGDESSWEPGEKGQGREGRSKGLGGSGGSGTGSSGPEEK